MLNSKQKIMMIVTLELVLIGGSFILNAYLESEWIDFGRSINHAGLNRFLTSETQLNAHHSIFHGNFKEKQPSLEKLKENLFLIKDGGIVKNKIVKPLPIELENDWNHVYDDYVIFEKNISSIADMDSENTSYILTIIDESSKNLIESSDKFVLKITGYHEKLQSMLIKLQIILLFANTLIHILMIYLIFLILNKDKEEKIQLERFATIGKIGATLAHDLRNSLTVIKGSIDILKINNNDDDKFKEKQYEKIDASINKIKYLTKDILDYTRNTPLKNEEFAFSEIIQKSINEMTIPSKILIKIPQNDYKIVADKIKLQIVVSNLIQNSIDAIGKEDGMITMDLNKNREFFIFSITDSAKDSKIDVSKIFTPLYTTKQDGTGLGLAGCKRIMEQHGGDITVNTYPTKFTIFIPRNLSI